MQDTTLPARGLPPECDNLSERLADIFSAHSVAAGVLEDVIGLRTSMPNTLVAERLMSAFHGAACEIEDALSAQLEAALAGPLSPADLEAVQAHADALAAIRPGLARVVDRQLIAALARRVGLAA